MMKAIPVTIWGGYTVSNIVPTKPRAVSFIKQDINSFQPDRNEVFNITHIRIINYIPSCIFLNHHNIA